MAGAGPDVKAPWPRPAPRPSFWSMSDVPTSGRDAAPPEAGQDGGGLVRRWLAAAGEAGRGLPGALLALAYPPSCAACGEAISEAHALCAGCWSRLSFISKPYCRRLGTPFAFDIGADLISPAAMADPPVFERARAVCGFDDVAREIIHRFKYRDRMELHRVMAGMMAAAGRELVAEADVLMPIPLHRFRIWTRRYNQAAELARLIGARSGKPVDVATLRRVKRTKPQVGLTRNERQLNLQGALRVAEGGRARIDGQAVLLIDDVLTTGSTANAAARALLRAGARRVDILTFARVIPGGA
jgi:ComF family protein